MSDDDWDNDDFEPPSVDNGGPSAALQFEGEDEDSDPADNWDDDEADEKKSENTTNNPPPKKKKSKRQLLREKEAEDKARRDREAELLVAEKMMTPEERYAKQLKERKIVEDADLELAKEFIAGDDAVGVELIEAMEPETSEDFRKFREKIVTKVTKYDKNLFYVDFCESLCRDLTAGMGSEDIRKVSNALKAVADAMKKEEQKLNRGKNSKDKKKKTKATLKSGKGTTMSIGYDDYGELGGDYADFGEDDFM